MSTGPDEGQSPVVTLAGVAMLPAGDLDVPAQMEHLVGERADELQVGPNR